MNTTATTTPFEQLRTESWIWRKFLLRRWDWVPDADAELDAAMWTAYTAGITDERGLFSAASTALRRAGRYHQRHQRPPVAAMAHDPQLDIGDTVVDRVAARQALACVEIPDTARHWIHAVTTGETGERTQMLHGRYWANKTRKTLELKGHHHATI